MVYVERRHDALTPHAKFAGAWQPDILSNFLDSMQLHSFVSALKNPYIFLT